MLAIDDLSMMDRSGWPSRMQVEAMLADRWAFAASGEILCCEPLP